MGTFYPGMARLQIADGGGVREMWRVDTNILKNHRTADRYYCAGWDFARRGKFIAAEK
jgi:hypothetical protein